MPSKKLAAGGGSLELLGLGLGFLGFSFFFGVCFCFVFFEGGGDLFVWGACLFPSSPWKFCLGSDL